MADETKADTPKPAPKKAAAVQDTTVPGGAYIRGGYVGADDKHYGGTVVNCDGEVLAEFGDHEVNDGRPEDKPENPRDRPRTLEAMAKDKPKAAAKTPADPFKGDKK